MPIELWKAAFDWATVVLIALTVVSGAGALITGNIIGRHQEEQLLEFQSRVVGLEKDTADAKGEMAIQQTRAANAEASLLELQERVKLRHLAPERRKKLIDFLQTPTALAVPKGQIRVQRLIFDETAQPFALEIKEAFAEGGWPSDDIGRDTIPPGGKIPVGIVLIFHDAQHLPAHAGLIQHALLAGGLEPTLGENPNVPEGMVEIMVGIKP
jgi:hypothetical protein